MEKAMEEDKPKDDRDDWKIYETLCSKSPSEVETDAGHDVITTLRSDLAALHYKRDKLFSETSDLKNQMLSREQRILEQQVEIDHLRETSARQSAVVASLRKKVQDLEDAARGLQSLQSRSDLAVHALERDNRYYEDKVKDLEKKLRSLELECGAEEQHKETARCQLQDLVRRLAAALGADHCDAHAHSPESLIIKAAELLQETTRLKNRCVSTAEALAGAEQELRGCREGAARAAAERDALQRQLAAAALEAERARAERDHQAAHARALERDLAEARDKLAHCSKSLGVVSDNVSQNESLIMQLKEELRHREEQQRAARESLAVLLSSPARFVDATDAAVRERVRELLADNKDKAAQIESLRDKLAAESSALARASALHEQAAGRARALHDERAALDARLHAAEAELAALEHDRDALRKDKANFVSFLERLSRALQADALGGAAQHTDALLLRAEQLARLESDKVVDKTAVVYQLQRRVRILREQLQRKDLHLDLLRRKLSVQEESVRARAVLQAERDEACTRARRLARQCDRLAAQQTQLHAELGDAAEYKITILEKSRQIEDLQKKLDEAELVRARYSRKLSAVREQARAAAQAASLDRDAADAQAAALRDELARGRELAADAARREAQLNSFRNSIAKLLGIALPCGVSDFEMVSRLQKLIDAHHDFTVVSRRYDDPALLRAASRSPPPSRARTRSPDRSLRYDDSGYADPAFDLDDELYKARAL